MALFYAVTVLFDILVKFCETAGVIIIIQWKSILKKPFAFQS